MTVQNAVAARLIALDWGTSNLRATLLGEGGVVLDARAAADGGAVLLGSVAVVNSSNQ